MRLQGVIEILFSLSCLFLELIPVVVEQTQPGLDLVTGKVALFNHMLGSLERKKEMRYKRARKKTINQFNS